MPAVSVSDLLVLPRVSARPDAAPRPVVGVTDAPGGLEGEGFFEINTEAGPRYTRDGGFRLDELGRIVTQDGDPVAGDGGGDIVINPEDGEVNIAPDGTVSQGENIIGQVAVVRFDDLSVLEKAGGNLLRNTSNLGPEAAPDVRVRQGMLESSNVKPILEITRMIEITRTYESVAKMMDANAELSRRSIERMGKVN